MGRMRSGEEGQTSGPSGRRAETVGRGMLVLRHSQTYTSLEGGEDFNFHPQRQTFMTPPEKSGRRDLN